MAVQQALWYGIVHGSILAVGALGFTLLFSLLNFLNIAYAEYMTVGAYMLIAITAFAGVPLFVGAFLAIGVVAVLSVVADRVVFQAFRDRSPSTLLVVSIGLSFILRSVIRMIWGSAPQLAELDTQTGQVVADVRVFPEQIVILGIALAVLGLTFGMLHWTRIGMAIRATSEDSNLARVRGVDTDRLVLYATVIGGGVAALAGVLAGLNSQVTPRMGFTLLIPIFAAVILGGIGDPRGAVVGGLSIGIVQELGVIVISSNYKPAIGLLLLIIGLITKPEGFFGKTTR